MLVEPLTSLFSRNLIYVQNSVQLDLPRGAGCCVYPKAVRLPSVPLPTVPSAHHPLKGTNLNEVFVNYNVQWNS
jgi:hypothetical protein